MCVPNKLYIKVHIVEFSIQTTRVINVLDKQAYTLEPYKNKFNKVELPKIAAAPIINMPVPKKKLEAIEIPKYFLKIIFKKVYKLAHPTLIIIFDIIAIINEETFTSKDAWIKIPEAIVPIK